ncbi:class I SAM-dependent methyltransferase [Sulfolobus sp. S-194]|uniref:class I SAM-dependent methyltransferase n=1 Tax=Sulfolobus sp. S-194 TaxID=2512240 RepID=UPI001436FF45|nr:methyltransferase [Sulfolobus sp. S-194]QIW23249.1 class I SAM-dependent methyltransferase [Sulfolobus sp. S-194]
MDEFVVNDVVNGIPLSLISSYGVFSKKNLDLGTRILLENIVLPEEGVVADIGCGYGPIGIYIALKNPNLKVYMIDIDKKAVYLAEKNVKRYKLENRVIVIRNNILENLDIQLKGAYSNPPLKSGKEFIEKLAQQSYERLLHNGILEVVVYKGEKNVLDIFGKYFNEVKIVKRAKGYSIILAVKN